MNWMNTVKSEAPAAPAVPVTDPMVAQLRGAAAVFAARVERNPHDTFNLGKAETCHDLAAKLARYGSFVSDKQQSFAEKLILWAKPRAGEVAAPQAPVQAPAPRAPEGVAVPHLFTVMQKHSTFHVTLKGIGHLRIARKNQHSLCWITLGDDCVGKLDEGRAVLFSRRMRNPGTERPVIEALLAELNENPLAAARKYGKLAGRCCSCGLDLTDPQSIAAGIGPICARKFG